MSKKNRPITFKGNGVTTCKCCEFPIKKTAYGEVCSHSCATELVQFKSLPLTSAFVISVCQRTKNENEMITQIKGYIARHNLDEKKVFLKFESMVAEVTKFGTSYIKRKENLNNLLFC